MSNNKLEETTKIIVEHQKFKNHVLPQDNLQKAYEKQVSTNLLKTQLF